MHYPCTSCAKPVKSNQQGILCDKCGFWTHAKCCGINKEAYQILANDKSKWLCPQCTLLYANVSLTSNCSLPDEIDTSNIDTSPYPSSSPNELTVCHLNVQSLLSKQDEISDYLLRSTSPTIMGLSETWLANSVPDTAVMIDGYKLIRKDRTTGRGGGILVYVPSSMRCRRGSDLEKDHIEALWLEVHTQRSTFLLCNIYRPPSADLTFIDDLDNMLELATNDRKEMVVMGDFNCNFLSPNPSTRKLTRITNDYQLNQIITAPTRISARSRTLIDLCFTSPHLSLSSSGVSPLTGSDHHMIYAIKPITTKRPPCRARKVRSFKKCDPLLLAEDVDNAPWSTMDTFDHIDNKWSYWKTLFLNIVNVHAPIINIRSKKLSIKWIDSEIRMLMRSRNFYMRKF